MVAEPQAAIDVIELMPMGEITNIVKEMLLCGYQPDSEPFLSLQCQESEAEAEADAPAFGDWEEVPRIEDSGREDDASDDGSGESRARKACVNGQRGINDDSEGAKPEA